MSIQEGTFIQAPMQTIFKILMQGPLGGSAMHLRRNFADHLQRNCGAKSGTSDINKKRHKQTPHLFGGLSTGSPQDLLTRTRTRSCKDIERISPGPLQELLNTCARSC